MLSVTSAHEFPDNVKVVGMAVRAVGGGNGRPQTTLMAGPDRLPPTGLARALLPDPVDADWLHEQGFDAKVGQSLVLRSAGGPPSVVLLGLGRATDDPCRHAEAWRRAGAALVKASGEKGTAVLLVPGETQAGLAVSAVATAVAEGASLAAYRFDAYRSVPPPAGIDRLVLVGDDDMTEAVRRGTAAAAATCWARDLINTPPSDMTPRRFADRVRTAFGGLARTVVEVWDEDRIADERLGGLLAVARGSSEPPRLVRASYQPSGEGANAPHVVLVGKGITFDSGGLSLKTAEGMTTMKTDMSGAAIVLAVVSACAALDIEVQVTALAPMAENMPGGSAVKPGDVFTARNGATIEVLNTDAEGRLVLADALSLAAELGPDAIVDVATLTGAARVALGTGVAPVLGSDDKLVGAVQSAGGRAGERLWPLPLPEDYGEHISSDVADMKNMGRPGEAGVIAAAVLLARFVGKTPWAHLDIAGTGRSAESSGYLAKGGTAFGVRTLLELLAHYPVE